MSEQQNFPEARHSILNRLRSAEGHLHAVIRMIETNEPCEQVLHQLDAVEAALCAAGHAMRTCEFKNSVTNILNAPDPETRAAEVERLGLLCGLPTHHRFNPEKVSHEETNRDRTESGMTAFLEKSKDVIIP